VSEARAPYAPPRAGIESDRPRVPLRTRSWAAFAAIAITASGAIGVNLVGEWLLGSVPIDDFRAWQQMANRVDLTHLLGAFGVAAIAGWTVRSIVPESWLWLAALPGFVFGGVEGGFEYVFAAGDPDVWRSVVLGSLPMFVLALVGGFLGALGRGRGRSVAANA
jgi:hypothetical protein